MGPLRKTFGLLIVAGTVAALMTPAAIAENPTRGLRVLTADMLPEGYRPIDLSNAASQSVAQPPVDCLPPPDQFPPCADPPCDLLEMLNNWCASNVDDSGDNPEGIICATSDLRTEGRDFGYTVADDIIFNAEAEIQGIQWWGLFIEFGDDGAVNCNDEAGEALPVALPTQDNWTIRYWGNTTSPVEGLYQPDEADLIAEFTDIDPSLDGQPGEGTFTREEVRFIGFTIYEMTYTFDPGDRFVIPGLERVWVEITNTSAYTDNECVFCWEVAFPNWNTYSLQQQERDVGYDPDLTGDDLQINQCDQAQCQAVCFNESVPNPPSVELDLVDSSPVDADECCQYRYTIRNENSPGAGPVTKFYMAVHRGNHAKPDCGEDLSEINPPPGWTVSYCEGWRTRQLGNSRWVVYQFDPTTGEIPELGEVYGYLKKIRPNDDRANNLQGDNPEDIVPAFGIRAWGSQHYSGDTFCGTGSNFDPLLPNVDEFGLPIWSEGDDDTCTGADGDPLRPIPAGTVLGKGLLTMLLVGAGVWLVVRSRRPVTI